MPSHSDPTAPDVSRRWFLKAAAALAATAPLPGEARAQTAEDGAPLMAYVGTFSSPLRDVLPTQVDLPPGNGRPAGGVASGSAQPSAAPAPCEWRIRRPLQ